MPTNPRQVPVDPSPEAARRRLHIHGIKEMPAGYDAEVAELFRDLRAASNLTEADLAAKLTTQIDTVRALEQGALYALPPWPETCRVVNAYGSMLNLDIRPLLRRIYAQLEAGIVELRPKEVPDVPVMPQKDADFTFELSPETPPARPEPQWSGASPSAPQQAWPRGNHATPPPQPAWPGGNHAAPSPQPAWPGGNHAVPPPQPAWPGGNHAARPPQQAGWPGGSEPASPAWQPGWPGNSQAPAPPPRPSNSPTPSQQAQWPGNAQATPPQAPRTGNAPPTQPQPAWQGSQQAAAQPSPARRAPTAPQQARASRLPQQPQGHPLDASFEPAPAAPQLARASQPHPQQRHPLDASFEPEPAAAKPVAAAPIAAEPVAATPVAEKAKKERRPPLLKWGLGALLVSVLVFGLWFAFSDQTGPSGTDATGSGNGSNPVLDPDDPRSRKADRLPNAF